MTCFTITALFLSLVSVVEAGQFQTFIVNVEDITNTNKQCKQTVTEQKNMMANLTGTIENLKATIEVLNTTVKNQGVTIDVLVASNTDLNSTLSKIQNGKHNSNFKRNYTQQKSFYSLC